MAKHLAEEQGSLKSTHRGVLVFGSMVCICNESTHAFSIKEIQHAAL